MIHPKSRDFWTDFGMIFDFDYVYIYIYISHTNDKNPSKNVVSLAAFFRQTI